MKVRESGMPVEATWAKFFDADAAIERLLGAERVAGDLVEFGCGYGTFTIPTAQHTLGIVTALDIEPEMVDCVQKKATSAGIFNIRCELRDFIAQGTGLGNGTQAHALIFNLLHLEQPIALLREALRVLRPDGMLSVIHWRSDVPTPRGPSSAIRPTPQQCWQWIEEAGFRDIHAVDLQNCCPYHFALAARCQNKTT